MAEPLFNLIMHDGSRHFGALRQTVLWYELRAHLAKLPGASVTGFVTDEVTEAWIDFSYRGQQFAVNDQNGEYWFFVADPQCADELLTAVLAHCRLLLEPH